MAYVRTIPENQATGKLKEIYDADVASMGYVPNYTKAVSLRPAILDAYRKLGAAIRAGMDLRRYEVVTTVVAAHLRCTY